MINNNCDQLAIDNNWDLVRETYCHIGVLNNEMGDVLARLDSLENFMHIQTWVAAVVGATIIALVVKKMWGTNGK